MLNIAHSIIKKSKMTNFYKIIRPLLFCLNAETSHNLSISILKHNLLPRKKIINYKSLNNTIFNINFTNPIGLAAGYDKNAEIFNELNNYSFGFIECGTVTPKAQKGNSKPRLFRLTKDRAIINRMGFNNKGIDCFTKNIAHKKNFQQIIGSNIGKNKDTKNEIDDYLICLEKTYNFSSYITINISSPNTKNLRNLQKADQLAVFLKQIMQKKATLQQTYNKKIPILLKIAPDLNIAEIKEIAQITLKEKIDGVIISNTTIDRDLNLKSDLKQESGGLSGKPLFDKSNQILSLFYQETKGKIPIIGVGGIENAQDIYQKMRLGASLVQIYSSLIYNGIYIVEKIKKELDYIIKRDGFKNVEEIIGIDNKI